MRRRSRAGNAGARAGFVLLDLVVTLAISGLLLALVFPHIASHTTPQRMHLLLTKTASLLREARTTAITQGTSVTVRFDPARRLIQTGSAFVSLPGDVGLSLSSGGDCRSDERASEIVFYHDGTNCGGVFRFNAGRSVYRLRVNWATGYVELAES